MIDTDAAILIVEDESILAMLLEDFLDDLGYTPPAVASNVSQALRIIDTRAIDFAILDINLGGEQSFPIADALDTRGIPYIFMTGYGAAGVPERLRDHYILQKPYGADALKKALASGGQMVQAASDRKSIADL
ncbi:response regulator [Luteimonas terrae]|uniref:DNA-binding NtrC family response regulator n=1 Tax=Luteimonas terrae TaxID=1530191 RepID=A0ABU1XUE7_9GAMM|nr:response regulator [Luteimonas terrae]MDR7192391.1 DNA-binding NtrC family response regulator [Luteimonas terrae]